MTMTPTSRPIKLTAELVRKLRTAYGEAVGNREAEFTFEGNVFYTQYAKYLLQHLEASIPGAKQTQETQHA